VAAKKARIFLLFLLLQPKGRADGAMLLLWVLVVVDKCGWLVDDAFYRAISVLSSSSRRQKLH
jgi:hypothetical protein